MAKTTRPENFNKKQAVESLENARSAAEWRDAVNDALYLLLGRKEEPEEGIEETKIPAPTKPQA